LNWSGIPDLAVIALLTCAFASVARLNKSPVSALWLTGWLMVLLHFAAALFSDTKGIGGGLALIIRSASLIWAALMFTYASLPYRSNSSSRWVLASLVAPATAYITILYVGPHGHWALNLAAALLGLCPLGVTLASIRQINHPLRWLIVLLYGSLSTFLLIFQNQPGSGHILAWNAIMFVAYFGNCVFAFYAYHRVTTGTFVTIAGFFAWASIFVIMPMIGVFEPRVHIESEVWNLPGFVVAVGMMLLLLEDQIESNKHLALHDVLTGLPNRRLFQDRIANALERSRRTGTQTALLMIDLDHFKKVNDTLGHHVGDLLLERVAAICSGRVRRSDTVARTGGDEFSVILEAPTSRANAEYVGHSLIQLLKEPLQLDDHTLRIGASVGIAIFPDDAADMESLCVAADLRMYEYKHQAASIGTAIPALE